MRVLVVSILFFICVSCFGQDYLKFKNEFLNIKPDRVEIIINKTPAFKSGIILFATFLINEFILIIKPDNIYNSAICGGIFLVGVTASMIVYRLEWKKFVYSNIFY